MRKEYAYILCVAGKIKKVIAKSWWNKPEEINNIAGDMFAAAYAFKKTVAILVYEKKNRTEWIYVSDHQAFNVYKPKEITIWANNKIDYETPIDEQRQPYKDLTRIICNRLAGEPKDSASSIGQIFLDKQGYWVMFEDCSYPDNHTTLEFHKIGVYA